MLNATISKEMRAKLMSAVITTNTLQRYEELAQKLHWFKIGEDGIPELYLDNHMLQTFRMCEAAFEESFIHGYSSNSNHIWFLDFGSVFHDRIENYYMYRKNPNFDIIKWAGQDSLNVWEKFKIDEYYKNPNSPWYHKDYDILGGFMGFASLLLQYAQTYHVENERFRVIGAELYFGKGKEVPLYPHPLNDKYLNQPFRMYLCGKIDLLMDDGQSIGPMDHKTTGYFRGKNPATNYELNDGLTGYVYAARQLLKQQLLVPRNRLDLVGRSVNKIWLNSIQVKPETNPSDRFKRVPLFKTDFQLEQYRLRQVSTGARIFQLLTNPELAFNYNTMVCSNWFHRTCPFQEVHRQNSRDSQLVILNSSFSKGQIWNPEERNMGREE